MDHILRVASSIIALINRPTQSSLLSSKTNLFIQMLQSSPLASFLPKQVPYYKFAYYKRDSLILGSKNSEGFDLQFGRCTDCIQWNINDQETRR